MNKKGFTLVEILGVIIILSAILLVIIPAVDGILSSTKKTVNDSNVKAILESTYDYSLKNIDLLPEYDKTTFITLNELKKHNYINNTIKDSVTKKEYNNDLVISIKNVGTNYKYTDEKAFLKGSYLYKIEESNILDEDKPTITFKGYNEENIVIPLNIGESFTPIEYESQSKSGIDLTDLVVENIVYNSQTTNTIDTSKSGIYYIYYSVVDYDGLSNSKKINVIVNDTEAPKLNIPENITLDISVTSYDIMRGVSCSDNSGKCEINVVGDVSYGVAGKYIIEYQAFDPAGNTNSIKRVITIK